MIKKHDIVDVTIEKIEFPDKGIGYIDGEKIIVRGSVPGQKINGRVSKIKNGVHVKPLELLEKSKLEIKSECDLFGICGGCTYQNISYNDELNIKETIVKDLIDSLGQKEEQKDEKKEGQKDFKFHGLVKAPLEKFYRNKMEFTFGDQEKGGELCLGMRKKNSYYETVNVKDCLICDSDFGMILETSLNFFANSDETFYHRLKRTGTLRNLIVRKAHFTGEILVNLVTTKDIKVNLEDFVNALLSQNLKGEIKGIIQTVNDSVADAVKVDELNLLWGQDYFTEKLLDLEFKITPFSFFQTNSTGAEKLYSTIKGFVGDTKDKTVFDLYCGTGTIAQIVSKTAKKVIGIELVEEAVISAKENAKINEIENCKFISGDVLKMVDDLNITPDIIILDPPREGIHIKTLPKLIAFNAKSVIYVSCKPTSLIEDMKGFIDAGYKITDVKCHDMFPRTASVETVIKLIKM